MRPAPQINFIPSKEKIVTNEDISRVVDQVNFALQQINHRVESDSTFETGEPPAVASSSYAVAGRDGGFYHTWVPVDPKRADGYVIVMAKDTAMNQVVGRFRVPDAYSNSYFISLGGSPVTRSFQIYAMNGSVPSLPSTVRTATSTVSTQGASGSSAPANTTFNGTETTLASVTFTATGRTVQVNASALIRSTDAATKNCTLRLKEDSTVIQTRAIVAPANTGNFQDFSIVALRNSAAGSHTYAFTGQNTTDNVNVDAQSIVMTAVEVPFSTSTEAESDPTDPPEYTLPPETFTKLVF